MDAFGPHIAEANDGKRRAVDGGGDGFVAQDVDAGLLKAVGNEGGVKPYVVVAEGGVNAKCGASLRKDTGDVVGEVGDGFAAADEEAAGRAEVVTEGDVVAGEGNEVGFLCVDQFDAVGEVFGADSPAAMQVGQVGDGQSVEGARQGWEGEVDVVDLDTTRFDKDGVNGADRCADGGVAGAFEECTAADACIVLGSFHFTCPEWTLS